MAIGPRGGDNTGMMVMSCSVSDFLSYAGIWVMA
jgi:hypothetical protein